MEKSNRQWLLLRGLTRGQFHWCDFPEKLKQKFPDDEVLMIDLPGNGFRFQEKSPLKVLDYTQDIRQKFQNKGALQVIAVSMGAMITLDWLSRFPEEIQKAYLVNTSVKGLAPFYQRLKPTNYPEIVKALLQSKLEQEKTVLKITSNNIEVQKKVLFTFEKMARQYPVSPANLFRQLVASGSFQVPEKLPAEKIQLFYSEYDRLVSCENTKALAKHLNIHAEKHPWAGHDLVLDDPDFLLSKLL